jgi:MFS family permease
VFGRPTLLLTTCLAWLGLSFCLLGLAPGYLMLVVLSGSLGVGAGLWHPPAMGLLSQQFPDRRGLVLSAHELAGNVGTALTPTLVGLAIVAFPWREVLVVQLLPGAVMAVLFWWLAPRLSGAVVERLSAARYRAGLQLLLRNRTVMSMALVSALRSSTQVVLLTFLPLYLTFQYQLDAAAVGLYVSVLASLGVLSPMIGGPISDRIGRRPVLLVGLLAVGGLVLLLPAMAPGLPLLLTLAGVGLFLFALRAVVFAQALDVAPPELGGSTVAVLFGVQQLGVAFAPLLVGLVADRAGAGAGLLLAGGFSLAAALVVAALPLLGSGTTAATARPAAG